jgi:hypothetical protein
MYNFLDSLKMHKKDRKNLCNITIKNFAFSIDIYEKISIIRYSKAQGFTITNINFLEGRVFYEYKKKRQLQQREYTR